MNKTVIGIAGYLIVWGTVLSAQAEHLSNSDFEADGYAAGGLNNTDAPFTGWTGPYSGDLRYDTSDPDIPGVTNTVVRLLPGTSIRQDLRVNIYSKNDPDSTNWVDGTVHGW